MITTELRNLKKVVVQRILLSDVRAITQLGAIIVIQKLLIIVGLCTTLVSFFC